MRALVLSIALWRQTLGFHQPSSLACGDVIHGASQSTLGLLGSPQFNPWVVAIRFSSSWSSNYLGSTWFGMFGFVKFFKRMGNDGRSVAWGTQVEPGIPDPPLFLCKGGSLMSQTVVQFEAMWMKGVVAHDQLLTSWGCAQVLNAVRGLPGLVLHFWRH